MWAIPDINDPISDTTIYRSFRNTVHKECISQFLNIEATQEKRPFGVANSIEMPPIISAL